MGCGPAPETCNHLSLCCHADNYEWVAAIGIFALSLDLSEEKLRKVKYEEEFILTVRGLKLFTCRWVPADQEPKALIGLCHGYGMECSIFMQGEDLHISIHLEPIAATPTQTGVRLANAGYAVMGIDYEGHGKSAGKRCYIQSFQELVNDAAAFFKSIAEREEYKQKARFLYGESMGGAVALLIHRKQPSYWNGAVLVAPMCKIAEELKPHPMVVSILKKLTGLIPTWKIVPTQDNVNVGFKLPEKRQEIRANPYVYLGKPRLKTGYELLITSMEIEKRLDEVTLPFLVLHGEADIVTDPAVSKLLYESVQSFDKTLKFYPDMWHGLTFGEPPEHTQLVFSDIIAWLDKRSGMAGCPEKKVDLQKLEEDGFSISFSEGKNGSVTTTTCESLSKY
eukprot:Gb_12904 [translate_table: standard]